MSPAEAESALAAEVAAIGGVLNSLEGLSDPARARVVKYVTDALGIEVGQSSASPPSPATPPITPVDQVPPLIEQERAVNDIRSLKESKQPATANQMAAVAAYYLSELAPPDEKSETIDAAELERLFKQAGFPMPGRLSNTLPNATAAGYFDKTGDAGRYKLNPVGYNLVVHSLPGGGESAATRRTTRKATKKTTKKKAAKKATKKAAKKQA